MTLRPSLHDAASRTKCSSSLSVYCHHRTTYLMHACFTFRLSLNYCHFRHKSFIQNHIFIQKLLPSDLPTKSCPFFTVANLFRKTKKRRFTASVTFIPKSTPTLSFLPSWSTKLTVNNRRLRRTDQPHPTVSLATSLFEFSGNSIQIFRQLSSSLNHFLL